MNTKLFAAIAAAFLFLGTAAPFAAASTTQEAAPQQQIQVSGTVVDAQGQPVPGASVIVKGTTNGTMTDTKGRFALSVAPGAALEISCIGYATQAVAAQENLRITLKDDVEFLDDVVVVGYGTQKRANLTGAVSTVDVGKTLESKSTTSVGKALQGAVPGLTILNVNGDINAEPSIVIRGIGTLSNSGTSTPLYVVDGVPIDNLSYLNPQDIATISVLKDAASTSIYGTRAAFGVVLITTKSAQTTDRVQVSYNNNFGWSQATYLPDYPTVIQQATAMNEANKRAGDACELFGMYLDSENFLGKAQKWQDTHGAKAPYRKMIFGDDYDELGYYADWDVKNIFFNKAAPSQNHTVSVQGTSGKTNYYMSIGHDREQSIMNFNPDKVAKWNATVNVSAQVLDWLQVGARVNFSDKKYDYPYSRGANSYQYLWRWGSFFGPYGWYEAEDGTRYECRTLIGARMTGAPSWTKTDNLRLGGFLKADIVKGLTFNADYTFTNKTVRYKGPGYASYVLNTWGVNAQVANIMSTTWMETSRDFYYNHVANAYFNYALDLAEKHHINLMAGANVDKAEYEYLYYERHDLMDENMPELALADSDYNYSHSHTHNGSIGFFGRVNYDYAGKYLAEFNVRRDGSSKFPVRDQWATFLSGSVGYRISEEAFWEPIKPIVNNAKIRASYGEIGNQEVGSNMYLETMSKVTNGVNWLGSGTSKYDYFGQPKMVSESLTWETIATTNIGVDLGFLNGDLNVTFDWFQRDTKGMLAPGKELPTVVGASAAYENAGSLRTRGWELNLDWHHNFGAFTAYAIGNLSDYKTVVTEWDSAGLVNTNYTDKEYGEIWGFETDRYFESAADVANSPSQTKLQSGKFVFGPGDIKFVDQNGDGVIDWGAGTYDPETGTYDVGDLVKIGNTTPRYQYSLRLGGEWNGFDLDVYFQGVGKRDMWTQSSFVMPFMRGVDGIYTNQMSYVTAQQVADEKIDQNAQFPALFGGGAGRGTISSNIIDNGRYNFYPQTKYLVNMAYLRLKNVTVGYTLPRTLTQKIKIDKVRVYAAASNLIDIINHNNGTGLDPEINTGVGSYANGVWGRTEPIYRTYSCGVQVMF